MPTLLELVDKLVTSLFLLRDVFSTFNYVKIVMFFRQALPSSDGVRGGIRIEYARTRMGEVSLIHQHAF